MDIPSIVEDLRKTAEWLSGNQERSGFGKSIYCTSWQCAEFYYLRLLLHKIRGPTSFTALKIVARVVQLSFQVACIALSLLEDDTHWNSPLEQASISEFPNKIRELFAILLVFCQVGDPIKLWEKHRDSLAEDVKKQFEAEQVNIDLYLDIIYNQCLILLEDIVISMSRKALLHFGFLSPSREAGFAISNHHYGKELGYDTVHVSKIVAENVPKFNQEQKEIYDKILNSITSNSDGLANGAVGKLVHVETNDEGLVKTVWLEFPDLPQIGGKLRRKTTGYAVEIDVSRMCVWLY
ncbi:ATP-dependent DNA helicase [Trichonephila clavata]|uniref:ATP-dependent DNA helicase n=1 Tax=Trichonephila clavata TaxID=2740835 RepID=A0A8X6EYG3_TRICU|nr:ATP-dependent DNA helicase [Trichonephila clavata]